MSRLVEDNPGESRFEIRVDGELVGWSEYRPAGDNVIVAHTEIDQRREGDTVAYIRRHPEYAELVDASLRGQFTSPD